MLRFRSLGWGESADAVCEIEKTQSDCLELKPIWWIQMTHLQELKIPDPKLMVHTGFTILK